MIADERIERTLALIRQSDLFRGKLQMTRLLSYLAEHSRGCEMTPLHQREIAINCLGREKNFDPNKDPIVRIEAARLRKLLDAFYDTAEAKKACCYISMPLGVYRLEFSEHLNRQLSTGLSMLLICQSHEGAPKPLKQLALEVRQSLSLRLPRFLYVNLSVDFLEKHQTAEAGVAHLLADEAHDYILRIEVVDDLNLNFLISSVLIHRPMQEIIWSQCVSLPKQYSEQALEAFYAGLISPIVGDLFGVAGQHWSASHWQQGIEQVDRRFQAFACLIQVFSYPTLPHCQRAVALLREHLRRNPSDIDAHFCFQAIECVVCALSHTEIESEAACQISRCLNLMANAPEHAGVVALLGFYYFKASDHQHAAMYLQDAIRLSPDSSLLQFLYGAFCLQEGREQQGINIINSLIKINKDPPALYQIPLFFFHLGMGNLTEAAYLATKVSNVEGLSDLVEVLLSMELLDASPEFDYPEREVDDAANDIQTFPDWVEGDLLSKYPKMKRKVKELLALRQTR